MEYLQKKGGEPGWFQEICADMEPLTHVAVQHGLNCSGVRGKCNIHAAVQQILDAHIKKRYLSRWRHGAPPRPGGAGLHWHNRLP
jgi:hypothetical protein